VTRTTDAAAERSSWTAAQVHRQALIVIESTLAAMGSVIEGETRHGLVVRLASGRRYDIVVKGARAPYYVWVPKTIFPAHRDQALALVTFFDSEPEAAYLVPGPVFRQTEAALSQLVKNRDYIGKQSEPEFGLYLNEVTLPLLERFRLDAMVRRLD